MAPLYDAKISVNKKPLSEAGTFTKALRYLSKVIWDLISLKLL